MTITRFYLCALPLSVWRSSAGEHGFGAEIVQFSNDALGCERRILKEVNTEDERSRYRLCCQRLENELILKGHLRTINNASELRRVIAAKELPVLALDPGYIDVLARTHDSPGPERLGASFFPPEKVDAHKWGFRLWVTQLGIAESHSVEQRMAFFDAAALAGCGVVEFQAAFLDGASLVCPAPIESDNTRESIESDVTVEIPEFATQGLAIEYFGTKGKKRHLAVNLRAQIRQALQSGEPVGFGNQAPHDVITEVLHEYVFMPEAITYPRAEMRVIYADGSEAHSFPMFTLPRSDGNPNNSLPPLRVALMSMRHFELDRDIDFCWFRNRDVSRTRTLSETDEFCYQSTIDQLGDFMKSGMHVMHLYHTGFEPAVIGFYRGLVKTLCELSSKGIRTELMVVPFYYRGGTEYESGSEWR